MPKTLTYTLVAEGPGDRILLPVIDWILAEADIPAFRGDWADLRFLDPPPSGLRRKLEAAAELYPADLILAHRDGNGEGREARVVEIREAAGELDVICLVPVQESEAWFLFDEDAIRQAAGNPAGRRSLSLPAIPAIEATRQPKERLFEALRHAADLTGRRRKQFDVKRAAYRLSELIGSFEVLRNLTAFREFEHELRAAARQNLPT